MAPLAAEGHYQENTRTGFVARQAALGFKSNGTGGCAALLASLPLGPPLGEKAGGGAVAPPNLRLGENALNTGDEPIQSPRGRRCR